MLTTLMLASMITVPHSAAGLPPRSHWIACAVITMAFAAGARLLRGTNRSGTVAGALVSFLLCVCEGPGAFAALLSLFVVSFAATRVGRSRKERLGAAEQRDGRKASQVLANLGIGTLAALVYAIRAHNPLLILATTAALAEAAADTVSSEMGTAVNERSHLITNWKAVPAGTDGGITFTGTLAGFFAALALSTVAGMTRLIPWEWVPLAAAAGTLGMLVDSFLGATLERRALLDNDKVNFLSTFAAAIIAFLLVRL